MTSSGKHSTDDEYRDLERIHKRLEKRLSELSKRRILTDEEVMIKKELQKKKLLAKDKMADIIRKSGSIKR
jgi:uncharacterized protein